MTSVCVRRPHAWLQWNLSEPRAIFAATHPKAAVKTTSLCRCGPGWAIVLSAGCEDAKNQVPHVLALFLKRISARGGLIDWVEEISDLR